MAKRFIVGVATLALLGQLLLGPAYAWNEFGHLVVAAAAYQQMAPHAKIIANGLLRQNPKFNTWEEMLPVGTPSAQKSLMIFMLAATWADDIKDDADYQTDGSHNGNRPEGSGNHGYSDHLRHKYWHFIDVSFSRDHTSLPAVPVPNAEDHINLFRSVLASDLPDPLKSYDLTWLLHLVGDIHQPLHCITRVNASQPAGDDGGNGVKLECPGCGGNLHSFWDGLLGSGHGSAALKPAIAAATALRGPRMGTDGSVGDVSPSAVGPCGRAELCGLRLEHLLQGLRGEGLAVARQAPLRG